MHAQKTVLVIGANGGIGSEACRALLRHGWRVRGMTRNPAARAAAGGIEQVMGDASVASDVSRAAIGADVIVHAVNPPGYRDWDTLVLPMLDHTIAAARAAGARIVLPGTVYNFGPDAFPLLTEDSPHHPVARKGRIRVEMERRLAVAADAGVPVLILRCGDFIGPRAGNNWFSQAMVRPGRTVRVVHYPGRRDIGHTWAYLPDVAETLARLLEREDELSTFEAFHFGGYWLDGHAMIAAIRRAADDPDIVAARFRWWLTALAAPFVETLRELREMRYLWQMPVRLDEGKLTAFLGELPHTPIDDALRATLSAAGCLRTAQAGVSAAAARPDGEAASSGP